MKTSEAPALDDETTSLRHPLAVVAAGLLLAGHCFIPLKLGDVYPFTTGPMFCDSPQWLCNYRVWDHAGKEMPANEWLVHRVYDGNPVGYGVGVRPPPVLEQHVGVVHTREEVEKHFVAQLHRPEHRSIPMVEVEQEVIGAVDSQRVGVIKKNRWKIFRE